MPLPQEVINRLSDERPATAGWSSVLLGFAGAILAVVVVGYLVIAFFYKPNVDAQSAAVGREIARVSQSVGADQVASLIAYYSQTDHVRTLLAHHVVFSQFLAWLEKNTEANVSYNSLSFASGNQANLSLLARSEGDINQQLAIYESDPNVLSVSVSNISLAGVSGFWQANVTIVVSPQLLAQSGFGPGVNTAPSPSSSTTSH